MAVKELFNDNLSHVTKIDKVLDTLEDSASAGKRKVTNDLIATQNENAAAPAKQFIDYLNGQSDPAVKFPLYLAFINLLKAEFDKAADDYVVSQIPAVDPNAEKPEVSDSERKALIDQRKALQERLRILGDMAIDLGEMTKEEVEAKMPKRRNLSGPRGKRAISFYVLTVDGVKFDSLADVAKQFGYDKAKDLTAAIKAPVGDTPGINLTNPPKEFTFTLKGGQTLNAVDTRTDAERGTAEATASEAGDSTDDDDPDED